MLLDLAKYHCRVCGLRHKEPYWGSDDQTPTFFICDCCGVEAGYQDFQLEGVRKYREAWKVRGMQWFDPKSRPQDWNAEEQLRHIPPKWL
jgi:hypothetical protein